MGARINGCSAVVAIAITLAISFVCSAKLNKTSAQTSGKIITTSALDDLLIRKVSKHIDWTVFQKIDPLIFKKDTSANSLLSIKHNWGISVSSALEIVKAAKAKNYRIVAVLGNDGGGASAIGSDLGTAPPPTMGYIKGSIGHYRFAMHGASCEDKDGSTLVFDASSPLQVTSQCEALIKLKNSETDFAMLWSPHIYDDRLPVWLGDRAADGGGLFSFILGSTPIRPRDACLPPKDFFLPRFLVVRSDRNLNDAQVSALRTAVSTTLSEISSDTSSAATELIKIYGRNGPGCRIGGRLKSNGADNPEWQGKIVVSQAQAEAELKGALVSDTQDMLLGCDAGTSGVSPVVAALKDLALFAEQHHPNIDRLQDYQSDLIACKGW